MRVGTVTAFKKLVFISTLAAYAATLMACGGGNSSTRPLSPGGGSSNPTPEPTLSRLNVAADNLQGTLLIEWQGEQYTLSPNEPVGEYASPSADSGDVTLTSPPFQRCEILTQAQTDQTQSLEVFCNTPITHFLEVNIVNLKGEVSLSWGSDTSYTFIQGQPFLALSSDNADVVMPEIIGQPNLQTCTGELLAEREINASFNIQCADAESENIVEITSDIPFPVSLRGTTNVIEVVDSSPVNMVGSQIDGISIEGSAGTQMCELEKAAFSEVVEKQRWVLSCREYTVHIDADIGVILTFDDQQTHVLEAGQFNVTPIEPVSRFNRQLVTSRQFGAKEIVVEQEQVTWRDIEGLPENSELIDYIHGQSKTYLLYQDRENQGYSLFQLGDNQAPQAVSVRQTELQEGESLYGVKLVPIYLANNEIAYTEIIGNEQIKQRYIVGILDGRPVREFSTQIANDNGFLVGGSHTGDAPFVFQLNDTNPLLSAENRSEMYILGQVSNDALIEGLDSKLNVVNWPDEQNNLRIWVMGKGLVQNTEATKLVELDIVRASDGPGQIIWREISPSTSIDYDSMGADNKLFVINAKSETTGHQVVSMFNREGPVNLSSLLEDTGMASPLRVQRVSTPLQLGENTDPLSRDSVNPVNGWVLLFSGEDDNAGSIWLSNGSSETTYLLRNNATWEIFNAYQLNFVGAKLAMVVDENGQLLQLNLRER